MGAVMRTASAVFRRLPLALVVLALAVGAPRYVSAGPTPSAYGLAQAVPSATYGDVVDLAMIPGSADEAIVVLKDAQQIRRVSLSGAFSPALFGDLSAYVGGGGTEEGLLSAAFSPDYANDGRIYVYYTQGGNSGQPTVLSRFQVVDGAMVTTGPTAETRLLEIPDFASNHNGGKIAFGPEGSLYLSLGDGGGGGDPNENGQDIESLLGKVLRINVTGQATYTIPPDNPFVGKAGRDEIFAYGFRNPWRMSADSLTGTIWVGDVGQNLWEEVEPVVKGGNYGWDCYEGFVAYELAGCAGGGFMFPRAAYGHAGGNQAVVGGYVYRGSAMPELFAWYIFADAYSGRIWAVDAEPGATTPPVLLMDTSYFISSFAEDADGELLVLTFGSGIHRLHSDGDGDGVPAHQDNCPAVFNPGGQGADEDGDLAGDACDAPGSGNINCDGAVNAVDALGVLRYSAGLGVVQNDPCLDLGLTLPASGELMGDVNCSSAINAVDALLILRAVAGLSVNVVPPCPEIKP